MRAIPNFFVPAALSGISSITAQPASRTVGVMTAPATADAALAPPRPSTAARSRHLLVLAALLALAGAGFTTARSLAGPEGTRLAPVCSETCGPLTTTEGDPL